LDYEDDIEVSFLKVQTEAEHLKAEIKELQKLLIEYDIELRKRNQMIAKIEAAMI
jgi:cell division septum initiation protein DivIVA